MYYFVNKEKYCQIRTFPMWFCFTYLYVLMFAMKLKCANYNSHWNILLFYDQWKILSDFNMSHGKMSDFVSFPLFEFILVINLRNFDFESHWNTVTFFEQKDMLWDLKMSYGKISDFVLFPLFGFTLVLKLRNFNFKGH